MSLSEKLNALAEPLPGTVKKSDVEALLKDVVLVEFDQSMHTSAPQSEEDQVEWAVLDTAYNLLRDTAVRLTMMEIRKQAAEQGVVWPSDEQLFAEQDDIKSYRDLAPSSPEAAIGLHAVFTLLLTEAFAEAQDAINGQADE